MSLVERAGLDTPERREQTAEILNQINERGVRYVRVVYPDLMGLLRGRVASVAHLKQILNDGLGFGARLLISDSRQEIDPSVRLGEIYDYGNCFLLPDPASFVVLPWSDGMGLVLADPYLPDGTPGVSCRLALRRAVAEAARLQLSLNIGLEVECILYPLSDAAWLSDRRHAFMTWVQGLAAPLLTPLWEALADMGVELEGYENELSAGQIEFNLAPRSPLKAADELILTRLAAQEMLRAAGYGVTFMAKFDNEQETTTSGLHVHQAGLNPAGDNIFHDPAAEWGLSPTALHYMGGQLKHAAQLTALSTPTITGYKRYRPGTWAPTSVTWSLDNRTSMLRVMPERDAATRVENRLPDSAANPYLTVAALILASTDGIRQKIDPGRPVSGDAMTDELAIPRNMGEAAHCLAEPSALTTGLGPELVTAYRGILLQTQARFEAHVTDWEIEEYRGVL